MNKITFAAACILSLAYGKVPEDRGYFAGVAYRERPAADKLADLWYMASKDTPNWDDEDVPYEELDDVFGRRMQVTTCRRNDELKPSHKKVLHPIGVVGLVSWEDLGGHPFTGLYDGGSDKGLIRFSDASYPFPDVAQGLAPSFAMKFLRDGMESVNMFGAGQNGFEPTDSWDFFGGDFFVSHIDVHQNELNRETIANKFADSGNKRIGTTGLGEFSRFTEEGEEIVDYRPPFVLYYVPTEEVIGRWDGDEPPADGSDFRDQLMELPAGTTLFEVWGQTQPEDQPGHVETHIANIRLTSELVKSKFGDERLFFQHETMRWDFAFERNWRHFHERIEPEEKVVSDYVFPSDSDDAMDVIAWGIEEHACPFAWLIPGLNPPTF